MIIFCFLTYNDIIPIQRWNTFFKNIDSSKYKVMIHPKTSIQKNKYQFPVLSVQNKIHTINKSHISIVKATLQLLKESYELINHEENNHFIFCSQNCIPLYDFTFYENFLKNCKKSILSCIDGNKKERYLKLDQYVKQFITQKQFVKQQPNMILTDIDVKKLINADFTNYFRYLECPDEHYFINVLLYLLKSNIIKSQTHFCNFDIHKTQAMEFNNINQSLLNQIKKMGFLFMRKVSH